MCDPKHSPFYAFFSFYFFRNYTVSSLSEGWYASDVHCFFPLAPQQPPTPLPPWLTPPYPTVLPDEHFRVYSDTFLFTSILAIAGLLSVLRPFYCSVGDGLRSYGLVVTPLSLSFYRFSPLCFSSLFLRDIFPAFFPQPGSKLPFLGVCLSTLLLLHQYRQPVSQLGTFLLLERGKVKSSWYFFRWSSLAGRIFQRFLLVPRFFFFLLTRLRRLTDE